jgi:MoaA/NifB/PqqE/SkfB family radical SAM enzyme
VQLIREEGLDRITFQAIFFETGNNSYKTKWYNDSHLWGIKEKRDYDYLDGLIKLKGMTKEIANPISQLRHFKKYFQNPDKTIDIPCMVGVHSFFIEPNGDVKLCYLFESIGNLKNNTPRQIWNSKKAIQIRKKIRNCELNCRLKNCNYNA